MTAVVDLPARFGRRRGSEAGLHTARDSAAAAAALEGDGECGEASGARLYASGAKLYASGDSSSTATLEEAGGPRAGARPLRARCCGALLGTPRSALPPISVYVSRCPAESVRCVCACVCVRACARA
eukprot:389347-Prymnesium_polylepis.1